MIRNYVCFKGEILNKMSQEVAIMKCSKEKTEDWKELLLKDFRLKITAFSETGDLTFLNETKTENVYLKN